MPLDIYIFGAGGLGREMAATLQHPALRAQFTLKGFIDDALVAGTLVNGVVVAGNRQWLLTQAGAAVLTGIGNPEVRRVLTEEFGRAGLILPVVVHPGVGLHQPEYITLGEGCYIGDGAILTTNISLGRHCFVLPGCSLSHDTHLGDCCTLMPGTRVSSGAHIGNNVVCGTATLIAVNTRIEDGSRLPAGTVIG